MSEQAQVGDTVRLSIEGVVYAYNGQLFVDGWYVTAPNRTYEILSRAIPPLPSEPGTWWLDRNDNIWTVDQFKLLRCVLYPKDKAYEFAPFHQLVLK